MGTHRGDGKMENPTCKLSSQTIFDHLEAVRENLLALSDDIWLSIQWVGRWSLMSDTIME